MKNILSNYTRVALLTFAVIMAVLGIANAKEMKMQESSYAPVMITKSFEAVREHGCGGEERSDEQTYGIA